MKEFFKSQLFQWLVAVGALLAAFFVKGLYDQQLMPFMANLGGVISAPFADLTATIVHSADGALTPYFNATELSEENERLRTENQQLIQQMLDYQNILTENLQFREFLEIKERNQDFIFEPCMSMKGWHH